MKLFAGVFIFLSFIGCNTMTDCSYQQPVDLKDGLNVSSLEANRMDAGRFDKINRDICSGKYGNIHSLLVIENDSLVIEQYYNGWDKNRLHFLASNTKSFNALLIGVAIGKGYIKNTGQSMLDFFPEFEILKKDTLKNKITIRDLLTMTSGFKWDEQSPPITDPNNMGRKMDLSDDWLKSALMLPMDTIPGTKYVYSGPNNIILGEIIKRSTGKNIAEFAEEYLFKPLGIKEYNWYSKSGIYDGGGGLSLKSRDIAKYGRIHLDKGKWLNTEIVSENWINEMFTPYIEIKSPNYGCYQWQMVKTEFGFNAWFIPGNGGQIINIIPDLDMVIVINADNRNIPDDKRKPLEYLIKDIVSLHPKMTKE
jgi:CubicO group peptidase (beta-lactamase class C family)